jgi:hypothetical protein
MTDVSLSRPRWRLPVIALLLLAPWTAECAWGGFTAAEFPLVVAILAPMYGGAAVVIREVARRTGGGWPTIAFLAAAFGVLQAALVDQSLLNPSFLDDTQFAEAGAASRSTVVGGLGISVEQLLDYVGGHIALSIGAPIAIVESYVDPARRTTPWLGWPGFAVVAVLYVVGSLLIFRDTALGDDYTPTTQQITAMMGLVLGLIAASFLVPRRRATVRSGRPAPHPAWVFAAVVAANVVGWFGDGWVRVGVRLVAIAIVVAVVVLWSRRSGWGSQHVLAGWGAGLIVAAGSAYLVPTYLPASPTAALVGDISISVFTTALLTGASLRLRRRKSLSAQPEQADASRK